MSDTALLTLVSGNERISGERCPLKLFWVTRRCLEIGHRSDGGERTCSNNGHTEDTTQGCNGGYESCHRRKEVPRDSYLSDNHCRLRSLVEKSLGWKKESIYATYKTETSTSED